MRALLQRVSRASVAVDGQVVGACGPGLLVLLGVRRGDADDAARWLAQKVATLRIFADEDGKMNRSLLDVGGQALVVSQFTLYGDARKGRRPSFVDAADPAEGDRLYRLFCDALRGKGVAHVQTGVFGAHMDVALHNDGPVTLLLDSP